MSLKKRVEAIAAKILSSAQVEDMATGAVGGRDIGRGPGALVESRRYSCDTVHVMVCVGASCGGKVNRQVINATSSTLEVELELVEGRGIPRAPTAGGIHRDGTLRGAASRWPGDDLDVGDARTPLAGSREVQTSCLVMVVARE